MQYEYDYDWMTLSSGQRLERLLLAQVLREVHFLGPKCTARDPGALSRCTTLARCTCRARSS